MVNYPSLPPNAPSPRLCVVKKSAAHQEYGFNLHAEKGKGQFVGAVDEGSPADRSGLRSADRIFAVNGESIVGAPHKEVVQKIKLDPLQCELLVINEEGALWYQEQGIPITPNLPNIVRTCSEFDLSYMPSHSATSTFSSNGSSRRSSPPMIISRASARLRSPNVNQYGKSYKGSTWYQTTHVAHYNSSTSNGSFEEYPKSTNNSVAHTSPGISAAAVGAGSKPMPPRPRLCTLAKISPSDEFGFNLHAERGKGHFIGAVDKDGIAERAGLETGQRIVGVNGKLIYPNTPHKDVVALIKQDPLSTQLLVASEEIDRWHTENNVPYSYDHVSVYEADARPRGPSIGSAKQPNVPAAHHQTYDPSRPVAKSNGSATVPSAKKENKESRIQPERLMTTYMALHDDPSLHRRHEVTVTEDHTTSIHVGDSVDVEDSTLSHSAGSADDFLIERVFAKVKPPAVLATDLYVSKNDSNQNAEESHDQKEEEQTIPQQETTPPKNGRLLQTSENTNKHVITGSVPSPQSNVSQSTKPSPLVVSPYPEKKPNEVFQTREYPSPISADSGSVMSTGSTVKDENRDIFKLNANEARQLMGRQKKKKDPRMQNNMSLDEKYNVIANL